MNLPKRLFLSPPHMGDNELRYVKEVFTSNYIAPVGPMIERFEAAFRERMQIPYAVAVSSGTAAMHLALRHLGVGPGDRVFASTLTFIGSVSPIVYQGAEPVFIDSDAETWNMDAALLEQALTHGERDGRLPKAVIPTEVYGQCCDLDRIKSVCEPYGIPVVCDSAESLGASYKGRAAGRGAYASIYSFNGNKIITTGGGGMLASESEELVSHACHLSTQARDPAAHYEHSEIGYNYRMSNVLAAIGLGQLELVAERVRRTRAIYDGYKERLGDLPGLSFMPCADYGEPTCWLTVVLVDKEALGATSAELHQAMEEANIEARPVWKPMHLQPVFKDAQVIGGAVAEDLFNRGLCLPSGTAMTEDDLARVAEVFRGAVTSL